MNIMLAVIVQIATRVKDMLSTILRRVLEAELRRAVALHGISYVRALVSSVGVSVDSADGRGRTPMHYALILGDIEKARFLLDNGANVNALDASGNSYFAYTVVQDHLELTQLLLEYGADTELGQPCTPLGLAIVRGDGRMVTLLLQHGANTDKVNVDGESPASTRTSGALEFACETGQFHILQLLLDNGMDINSQNLVIEESGGDAMRLSPLCAACLAGNLDIARFLLRKGARVLFCGDIPGCSSSALICALSKGSFPVIQLLVEHISRAGNSRDGESSSLDAMGVAGDCLGGKALLSAVLEREVAVVQLFLDHGANVNKEPVLVRCIQEGWVEGARLLLDAGADVNRADHHGEFPLWAAASAGHVDLVKEFLTAGASINTIHEASGETPLGVAYRKGHMDVVYLLLRASPHVWSRLRAVW